MRSLVAIHRQTGEARTQLVVANRVNGRPKTVRARMMAAMMAAIVNIQSWLGTPSVSPCPFAKTTPESRVPTRFADS